MSNKFANISQTYAKKRAAKSPAKCATTQQKLSDQWKKKNTWTYAHKAALNVAKPKDRPNQKKTLMWHNNMNENILKVRN
jgi:hypothetical protein